MSNFIAYSLNDEIYSKYLQCHFGLQSKYRSLGARSLDLKGKWPERRSHGRFCWF
jgi:hypothetical protein